MQNNTNPELELAYNFIQYTKQNIFLTGKAGTGKTTFLRKIKAESYKRTAVVAPTGIAAINAKGVTIHSLFQLPFGPNVPGRKREISKQFQFSKKKVNLLRSLDLLIIDEISMVRADVLDGIDEVLRRYKDWNKPFGGVQLLMIGDLHQLPPVVKSADWELLKEHYTTAYFFGSNALKETKPITIQLTHIYRQSDDVFIKLLNKVRDNKLDEEVLNVLNSRYVPNFKPIEKEGYITLTSHNRTANTINKEKLSVLPQSSYLFKATIKGDFPENNYPTEEILEFKVGAQVLFIKNDNSRERAYYNGKIGQITAIEDKTIYVKCPNDKEAIAVKRVDWKNIKYSLDANNEIEEEEKGVFIQYPLKLAWAITIHKSQGLTFERAIIDAQDAFAHGQVYVALSRCKKFEGIVLRSTIGFASVKTDVVVKDYSEEAEKNAPDEAALLASKKEYQQELIEELFSFARIKTARQLVDRIYLEFEKNLTTEAREQFELWEAKLENTIFAVAKKFQLEVQIHLLKTILPEENEALQKRMQKAAGYFFQKIKEELLPEIQQLPTSTDNQEVQNRAREAIKFLSKALFVKQACFDDLKVNFSTQQYLKTRARAGLNFEKQLTNKPVSTKPSIPANIPHPDLYAQLLDWRRVEVSQNNLKFYDVMPTFVLKELVTFLPTDLVALKKIKGVGTIKVSKYGLVLIKIIKEYCQKKAIESNLNIPKLPKPKEGKGAKTITFNYYKAGNTISEIAQQRSLTKTTVLEHLKHYVLDGELNIYELIEKEKIEELEQFFKTRKTPLVSEAKAHFGDKYSYGELRIIIEYLRSKPPLGKKKLKPYPLKNNFKTPLLAVAESTPTMSTIPPKAYSVENIRKIYPNAYKPWKEEEERKSHHFSSILRNKLHPFQRQ